MKKDVMMAFDVVTNVKLQREKKTDGHSLTGGDLYTRDHTEESVQHTSS